MFLFFFNFKHSRLKTDIDASDAVITALKLKQFTNEEKVKKFYFFQKYDFHS